MTIYEQLIQKTLERLADWQSCYEHTTEEYNAYEDMMQAIVDTCREMPSPPRRKEG